MEQISQTDLKKMMLFSSERIERDKEQINKINVFPVPDQDTGNNLSATLKGIASAIGDKEFKNMHELSDVILDSALTAAQGNTGVIFTGFLSGFLPIISKDNYADAEKLTHAFEKGYEKAKSSMQDPKEGTVLDILQAFSISLKENLPKEKDIVKLFYSALEKSNEALLQTRNKMDILRKAGVVDAGALGFVMVFETYLDTLKEQEEPFDIKPLKTEIAAKPKRFIQILSNRYEVVAILNDGDYSEKEMRERLKNLGNCLDIIQIKERTKIHIHTDNPYEVRDIIREMGDIEALRIEDMAKEITGEKSIENVSIGIVTDERAGLTSKIISHYNIEVIPFKISWPEGEKIAGDNICQRIKEAKNQGIISQPKIEPITPEFFMESYKKQLESFEDVLCIVSSSKLSDNYKSALKGREMLNSGEKNHVHIIDSRNINAGQAVLILEAVEMITEQRKINEIVNKTEEAALRTNLYCVLEKSDWWNKGKIKYPVRYAFGEIKNGRLVPTERIKTKDFAEALFDKIMHDAKKDIASGKRIRVVITHGDNLEQAQELKAKIRTLKRSDVSFINITDPVTSINACPQSLFIGWIIK